MAPKVQTLSQVMAELNPAYKPQIAANKAATALIPAKYDAQRAGIEAEKVQGFNQINNQATGRGMSFSGIPADEQATYLATKYLPGLMTADFQENEEALALRRELADIYSDRRKTALGMRNDQRSTLANWNLQPMQEDRADSRAAASRAQNAPKTMSPSQAASAIIAGATQAGRKIDANTFQLARDAYRAAGGDTANFAGEFWKYVPAAANTDGTWRSYYYG